MDCLLKLYISGKSPLGISAIKNLKKIIDEHNISCNYKIIDILENPEIAEKEKILATPLLIIINSKSSKRIVGDLSDSKKVLLELNLTLNKK